jgi:hypothetical protein
MEKPFYKKTWFIVLVTLLVFGVIGNMVGIKPKTANEKVAENSTPKQYVEIMKFKGTGQKKSEPFTVVVEGKDGRHVKLVFPGFKVTMSTTGPEVRAALEESLGSMGLKVVQGGKESKSSSNVHHDI